MGGSLRVPAAFNGVLSFKPTCVRVSLEGNRQVFKDSFTLLKYNFAAPGPIANSVSDLITSFKVQLYPYVHHLDFNICPTTFKQDTFEIAASGKIRIGYLEELEHLPLSSGMRRTMREARQALIDIGYEVVDFKITTEEYWSMCQPFLTVLYTYLIEPSIQEMMDKDEDLMPEYK